MAEHLLLSCPRRAAECQHHFGDYHHQFIRHQRCILGLHMNLVEFLISSGHLPSHVGIAWRTRQSSWQQQQGSLVMWVSLHYHHRWHLDNDNGCIHNQRSRSARTHLRKIRLQGQLFISHAHEACDVSIPIANSKWPVIGTAALWDIMTYSNSVHHGNKTWRTCSLSFGLDRSRLTNLIDRTGDSERNQCEWYTGHILVFVIRSQLRVVV